MDLSAMADVRLTNRVFLDPLSGRCNLEWIFSLIITVGDYTGAVIAGVLITGYDSASRTLSLVGLEKVP